MKNKTAITSELDELVVAQVAELTNGNPLYVLESVHDPLALLSR